MKPIHIFPILLTALIFFGFEPYDGYYYPWLERPTLRTDMLPDSLPPNQGTDDYVIIFNAIGPYSNSQLGRKLVLAGDQNGDGYDDILATCFDPQEVRLYFGGNPMDTIPDMVFPAPPTSSFFGELPTELADVNGDGDIDIIVGSSFGYSYDEVYIYYGGDLLDDEIDLTLVADEGSSSGWEGFGYFMSCGDINGDHELDLIVSACNYQWQFMLGKIFIYYGGTNFDSIPDFTITGGCNDFGDFGAFVSISGDVNNDGFNDMLSMFHKTTPDSDGALMFYGSENLDSIPDWTYTVAADVHNSNIINDLNDDGYDEIGVVRISNMQEQIDLFFGGETLSDEPDISFSIGWNVPAYFRSTGDVNADGYNDMITGCYPDNVVRLFFGGNPMDNEADLTFYLEDAGMAVGSAGDVNNDGIHDFMFYADTDEQLDIGQFFIYSDPSLTPHVEPWYGNELPKSFSLHQNFPNPFNGATVIPFQCNKSGWVDLNIYNILGQKVYSLSHNGSHGELVRVLWDGTDVNGNVLPSGVYLVELSDGWERQTIKMEVLR